LPEGVRVRVALDTAARPSRPARAHALPSPVARIVGWSMAAAIGAFALGWYLARRR
jgi:hypothetical protein